LLFLAHDDGFGRPFQHHHDIRFLAVAGTGGIGNRTEKQELRAVKIALDADIVLLHIGHQNRRVGCGQEQYAKSAEDRCQSGPQIAHNSCTVELSSGRNPRPIAIRMATSNTIPASARRRYSGFIRWANLAPSCAPVTLPINSNPARTMSTALVVMLCIIVAAMVTNNI